MQRGGWRGVAWLAGASAAGSDGVSAVSAGAAPAGWGRSGLLLAFGVPRPVGMGFTWGLRAARGGVGSAGASAVVLSAAKAVRKSVI